MERDYRQRYKQRVERQFKIGELSRDARCAAYFKHRPLVKPDATQDEVNAVVNDVSGGGDQIFAQAVRYIGSLGELDCLNPCCSSLPRRVMANPELPIEKCRSVTQTFSV